MLSGPKDKAARTTRNGKKGRHMTTGAEPIEITDANFDEEVGSGTGLVMVDFWAEWCGPCRIVGPIVDELAAEFADRLKVGKLDVDENPGVAQRFNIRSIPSILFFRDGELVDTVVGAHPKANLERKIREHS
jgi:thioredoxin 1